MTNQHFAAARSRGFRCLRWAAALVFTLGVFPSGTAPAASTLLFENLRHMSIRLSVGDASLTPTNSAGSIVDGPKDIAVGELNGDAWPDLAVANKDGTVTLLLGAGLGQFAPALHLRTDGGELRGLAIADFSGDGQRDVAVAAPYDGTIFLFINQGGGSFARTNFAAWRGARDLAAGDFDGDGRPDLAAAGTTTGVAHYRNLGGARFELQTNVVAIGTATDEDFPQPAYYLRAFRVPGSDRDDLTASRAQLNQLYVLHAGDDGRLAVQGVLTNLQVNALDVGPLLHPAAQGTPDLVISHNDRGVIEIHSAISTSARFNQVTNQQIGIPGGPRNVRIVDLDGDGWNDLVVVQQLFNKVMTLKNLNGAFVPAAEASVGAQPREMDVGDFNEDGHPDVAVLNRFSSDVSILTTFPGAVGFAVPDSIYPVDGEVAGLEVRDFNNDALADVLQFHRASGEMSVRLAQTNGVLGEPKFYSLGLRPIGKVAADINGDGTNDLVTAEMGPYLTVRLGLGNGEFGLPLRVDLPDPVPTSGINPGLRLPSAAQSQLFSIEAADFDHDGKLDLVAGFWDCRIGFFQGHGDGTFSFTQAHVLFAEPRGLTAGDFDQDGDLDLVCASVYDKFAVIENHGDLLTAKELPKQILELGLSNPTAIKAYLDNDDADLDLLVVSNDGPTLYLGGPGLSFSRDPKSVSVPGLATSSAAAADFDGDGDSDIAASCPDLACVSVSLRQPNGEFALVLNAATPPARYLAAGDLDGDGLPDLVGTGESLWVALSSRPLQWRGPRLLPVARAVAEHPVINEVLAVNDALALDADGGRNSDWLEIFNGASTPISLAGWKLSVIRTNAPEAGELAGDVRTNVFAFPTDAVLAPGSHRLVVFADKRRSPYHTGFPLPGDGATLCMFNANDVEVDRVDYPAQQPNISYSRFRDGMASFMACNFPTPGAANTDSGPVRPTLDFLGLQWNGLGPGRPIQFSARSTDDVGVMGVVVLWRRLDLPNSTPNRLVLADDGMNNDGALLDGIYSGILPEGLPARAEIEFYLQSTDISELSATAPGNPTFSTAGQPVSIYSLAVGVETPLLEISEVLAHNQGGLQDEGGSTPDWIEIRNASDAPVPLAGVSLAQRFFGNGERLVFSNDVTLRPGEHVVVFADNNAAQGPLHAPFKINRDGDELILTGTAPNGARFLIDRVAFGQQAANVSWSRLGFAGPWRSAPPTPAAGNVNQGWAGLVRADGTFTLGFPTAPGLTYVVEYADAPARPTWTALPPIAGDGLERTITQPMEKQRYFRVRTR